MVGDIESMGMGESPEQSPWSVGPQPESPVIRCRAKSQLQHWEIGRGYFPDGLFLRVPFFTVH